MMNISSWIFSVKALVKKWLILINFRIAIRCRIEYSLTSLKYDFAVRNKHSRFIIFRFHFLFTLTNKTEILGGGVHFYHNVVLPLTKEKIWKIIYLYYFPHIRRLSTPHLEFSFNFYNFLKTKKFRRRHTEN